MPVRLFDSIFFLVILLSFFYLPLIMRNRETFFILYHQGNDPSTRWFFFWSSNGRIHPGSGRTAETTWNPDKGLCTKNGETLLGCIRRHGKRYFYVSNRGPSLWNCWSCSGWMTINSLNFASIRDLKWTLPRLIFYDFYIYWLMILLIYRFYSLNKKKVIHNHTVRIDLNQPIMYMIQHAND